MKSVHFLPIKVTYSLEQLANLYVREIVRLHGVPTSIIFNSNIRFMSTFWRNIQQSMGMKRKFSSAFHPQIDSQSEWTIQTLEDMLQACVMDFKGTWNHYLSLVEFLYNKNFQASIGMAPYEALYGKKCRSPIHWYETGETRLSTSDFIEETTEAIKKIRQRMETTQSRQKSYMDK